MDRFLLKVAGSRYITDIIRGTSRPSVDKYIRDLEDIAAQTKDGQSALHISAAIGYQAAVQLLLKCGVNSEGHYKYSKTPLDFASENGHKGVVKLLLKKGV